MKRLPIGISNFKTIIEDNYYYVDKTLLIKELLDKKSGVTLLPRPRRFGKTLNLSMLYYFFSKVENAGHLFANTAIVKDAPSMAYQGKYPVIFLSFKDVKETSWIKAYEQIVSLVVNEFDRHKPVAISVLSDTEKQRYEAILDERATETQFGKSLKFLSDLLYRSYQQKVIILLDEYDTPIQMAFQSGYYQEMVGFMRNLLSGALKDNDALELSVMTGILCTAKEGIFSGLNNLVTYTILREPFIKHFGFTQQEVDNLLADYSLQERGAEIKAWYNGYQFAGNTMYNPWSLLNCMQENGKLIPYWANTSDNALIKKLLIRSPIHLQMQLEQILNNESVRQPIQEAFVYPAMESNETALWSLLVFSGYLTIHKQELVMGKFYGDLVIPNTEVRIIYEDILKEALSKPLKLTSMYMLHDALTRGDGTLFEKIIREYLLNSISMFDLPNNEPEKSYHLFVLGLLVTLSDNYEIISNRESGYGRYDIMIIPKDIKKRGIIIEFKRAEDTGQLVESALQALEQIVSKQYAAQLRRRGISLVTAFGIAFKGKEVLLKQEEIE